MDENNEHYMLIAQCVTLTEEFSKETDDGKPPRAVTSEDCIVVSKTLQGIFHELAFGDDWKDEDFVNLYIDEIDVVFPLLERIQSKFGQDGILWAICVLIEFISKHPPDILCNKVLQRLFRLLKILNADLRHSIFRRIVAEWTKLASDEGKTLCLNPDQSYQFVSDTQTFNLDPVVIDFTNDDGGTSRVTVIECLLNLMLYDAYDFSQMPEHDLIFLCGCLVQESDDSRLAAPVISMMHKLIKANLVGSLFFVNFVDVLFAYCRFLKTSQELDAEERQKIEKHVRSTLEVVANVVGELHQSGQLPSVSYRTLLPFASDAIQMIMTNEGAALESLLKFLIGYCRFVNGDYPKDEIGTALDQISGKMTELLSKLLVSDKTEPTDVAQICTLLLKIKGIPAVVKLLENILKGTESEPPTNARIRSLLVSALCLIDPAPELLSIIVPNEEQLKSVFESLQSDAFDSDVVAVFLTSLAKLTKFYNGSQETLLSFISLPWIYDVEWTELERFQKSLSLLVPVMKMKTVLDGRINLVTLKSESLKAIARLNFKNEWRSIVFKQALNSKHETLVLTALDTLPLLFHSISNYPFLEIVSPLLESCSRLQPGFEDGQIGLIQSLLNALSSCFCIAGKDYDIEGSGRINCRSCKSSSIVKKLFSTVLPDSLVRLSKLIIDAEGIDELKMDFINLLSSILKHVDEPYGQEHRLIEQSFDLLPFGGAISCAYRNSILQEVVKMNLPDNIMTRLQIQLRNLTEETDQLECYACCAMYGINEPFALSAFIIVIHRAAVRIEKDVPMLKIAKSMVNNIANKQGIKPTILFRRYADQICNNAAQRLVEMLKIVKAEDDGGDPEVLKMKQNGVLDYYFLSMATIFSMNKTGNPEKNYLDRSLIYFVPCLVLHKDLEMAKIIIQKICKMRGCDQQALIISVLPQVFWTCIVIKKIDCKPRLFYRLDEFCGDTEAAINLKPFKCIVCIILSQGKNGQRALPYLEKIYEITKKESWPDKFDYTILVQNFYLGILLELRNALADDYLYFHRENVVYSICTLTRNLNSQFLSQMSSKMINLLKMAPPSDAAIDAWMAFLESITQETLEDILPQLLFAVASIHNFPGANRILEFIFAARQNVSTVTASCERFDRAVYVLHNSNRPFMKYLQCDQLDSDKLIIDCSRMLLEEGPEVQALVLPKVVQILENGLTKIEDAGELVRALLYALKTSSSDDVKLLIGLCIGKIGAIDPGRMGMTAVGDNSKHIDRRCSGELKCVDDMKNFFEITLVTCAKLLMECTDSEKADFIGYSIQLLLKELSSPELKNVHNNVMKSLKPEILREIEPFKKTSFTAAIISRPDCSQKPFVKSAGSYSDWLWQWYFSASNNIRDLRLSRVFKALQAIWHSGDFRLPQLMLPQVILQSLLERSTTVRSEAIYEIHAVFEVALNSEDNWIRLAAHTCFQIIEFIDKFNLQLVDNSTKKSASAIISEFLTEIIGKKIENSNILLSVAVAVKYCSSCRALRWLEQYGMPMTMEEAKFEREGFYMLEKIYFQLGDVDGVLGAFDTIKLSATPLPCEQVVAFEAIGDYTEALPLYQKTPLQKVSLVKCLLRLNQPHLAYTTASSLKNNEEGLIFQKLQNYEMEAAYRVEDWEFLKEKLKNGIFVNSWGAHVAAILSSINEQSITGFETSIKKARKQVVESLQAVTMDDADTYSQAYHHIKRLHTLFEIEDGANVLKLFPSKLSKKPIQSLLNTWEIRSENVIQCSSVLEPIYSVRRSLLKMANPVNTEVICAYSLESCKLARQAGHLSTAWSHLNDARNLQVSNELQIDIEHSRYLFQKGEQSDAVAMLKKAMKRHFPVLMKEMENEIKKADIIQAKYLRNKGIEYQRIILPDKEREDFVNAGIVLTEFMEKAYTANTKELYRIFRYIYERDQKIPQGPQTSEMLAYRFAVFYDRSYYMRDNTVLDNVKIALTSYIKVLATGRRYMLHVMPRLLTIWFDFTALQSNLTSEQGCNKTTGKRKSSKIPDIGPNQTVAEIMKHAFYTTDDYCFFIAFPQLVSHICHPSNVTFELLKEMIIQLMNRYPHECMWQIIASYRAGEGTQRHQRTNSIFEKLKNQDKSRHNFNELIKHYNYVASRLIGVAEDTHSKQGISKDFNKKFSGLSNYFKNNTVKVSVPFISMVEKQMPTFLASQIEVREPSDETIYITGFEDEYYTFGSLEKPKKITMIGSNGIKYPLIAKRNDELRKDARCLDFCRTVNTLLLRDPEARRRQLHIRTYCVIPLQGKGGIIEWVPNLIHFRQAVASGIDHSGKMATWQTIKGDPEKRQNFFKQMCENTPLKMAEYLRNNFPDPCKWYGARLAFTRTAAAMSMVGFVLGLGDRHGENILVDCTNGEICHVDFNVLFNKGEDLPVPERVPFRLTRNIVDGFGPTGVEGSFRKSCEIVMRVLREEREMLGTVLQTFIYDPLLEWDKIEQRNQQMRHTKNNQNVEGNGPKQSREEIDLIRSRLEGTIATRKYHPLTKSVIPMSVEGQVDQLIRMATDMQILADMYFGWNPHL